MEPGLLLDSSQGRWAFSSLPTRGFDAPALGCLVPAPKSSERSQGLETVNSGSDALRGLWILGLVSVPGPVFRDHPEHQRQPSPALTQLPGRSPLSSTGQKEGILRARVCHLGALAAASGHFQIPAAQRGFPGGREDSGWRNPAANTQRPGLQQHQVCAAPWWSQILLYAAHK